jgi:hypothetical protein
VRLEIVTGHPGQLPNGDVVPSLPQKLAEFARSSKGRELTQRVKETAAKPENRAKIEQLRARLARKR